MFLQKRCPKCQTRLTKVRPAGRGRSEPTRYCPGCGRGYADISRLFTVRHRLVPPETVLSLR